MTNKYYYVGVAGRYKSVQDAIDALLIEQEYLPFEDQVEIVIENGVYSNFQIPDSSFIPTSTNRLIIRSENKHSVVIEGGESTTANYAINIGQNNPYITIKDIEIRNFFIGILIDTGSDYCVIDSCLIKTCANTCIFTRYNDNFSLYNSILLDGDFGLVAQNIKNISIVNNTFFTNNKFATNRSDYQSCILISLADDFGNGLNDTGTAWIRNNIFYNISQYAAIFFKDDLVRNAINSDYNNYFTNSDKLIYVIEQGLIHESTQYDSLWLFRQEFNIENNSTSVNPEFIRESSNSKNYYELDLSLLKFSPIKELGQQITSSPEGIPTWIDLSYVYSDFYGYSRPVSDNVSIGAIEISESIDLLDNPNNIPMYSRCIVDPYQDIIDRFSDNVYYPLVKSGFFFIEEKKYYLYANKQCFKLKDCAISEFYIPGKFIYNTLKVYCAGQELSKDFYDIKGNILTIWHYGIDNLNNNTRFKVTGKTSVFTSGTFLHQNFEYYFIVKNGVLRILLPEPCVMNGAPVIVTDDTASLYDTEDNSHQTYSVIYNNIYNQYELVFDPKENLISNSAFWNIENEKPLEWYASSDVYYTGNALNNLPISSSGFMCISFTGSQSYLYQNIHIRNYSGNTNSYRLNFYAFGSGDIGVGVREYDLNNNLYSSTTITGELTTDFTRYGVYLGDIDTNYTGLNDIETIGSFDLSESTASIDIEFFSIDSNVYIDAVQLTQGSVDLRYRKKIDLNNWSVEYEGSSSGFYEVKNLLLSPLLNYNLNGFLSITNVEATRFDPYAPESSSILNEYNWFSGRQTICPWARLYGRDKFKDVPVGYNYEISGNGEFLYSPYTSLRGPKEIQIFPTYLISSQDSYGSYGHVQLYDEYDNPMPYKSLEVNVYDPQGNYPGVLESSEYGITTFRGVRYSGLTESAGMFHFKWIPPSSNDISFVSTILGYSGNNYIDTKYRISLQNYSNVTLKDISGNNVTLYNTGVFSGTFYPIQEGKYNYIYLPYYPVYNSLYVYYNENELEESKDFNPRNEEFYFIPLDKKIKMPKSFTGAVNVVFNRSYVWVEPNYGRRIFFDSDFSESHTGSYLVNHDAQIILSVKASDNLYQEYTMIAQNNV